MKNGNGIFELLCSNCGFSSPSLESKRQQRSNKVVSLKLTGWHQVIWIGGWLDLPVNLESSEKTASFEELSRSS